MWLGGVLLAVCLAGLWELAQTDQHDETSPHGATATQPLPDAVALPQRPAPYTARPTALPTAAPRAPAVLPMCRTFEFRGAHTARILSEAEAGAIEDVKDVCPSHKTEQLDMNCSLTMDGHRCVARVSCQLCGDHLNRFRDANGVAK